ncbi:C2 family cysteine protease [Streptomyces sp. NPDC059382]|uniref:C2 family cysteine protease n=1 Tax=Streptomyces sp. NPDC059382 TaxID=3346816 RepID=UPI003698863F
MSELDPTDTRGADVPQPSPPPDVPEPAGEPQEAPEAPEAYGDQDPDDAGTDADAEPDEPEGAGDYEGAGESEESAGPEEPEAADDAVVGVDTADDHVAPEETEASDGTSEPEQATAQDAGSCRVDAGDDRTEPAEASGDSAIDDHAEPEAPGEPEPSDDTDDVVEVEDVEPMESEDTEDQVEPAPESVDNDADGAADDAAEGEDIETLDEEGAEAVDDSGPAEPESVDEPAEPARTEAAGAGELDLDAPDADVSGRKPVPTADAASAEAGWNAEVGAPRPEEPGEPETASFGDFVGRVRDALSGRKETTDQAGDRYATVDRPSFNEWAVPEENTVLYRYDSPLDGSDGKRIPLFDGPPTREQTKQGSLNDCGVIATMGAVAGHRPEAIPDRIRANGDGTYEVTLHQTKKTFDGDWSHFEPTGEFTVLTVTPELPVLYASPEQPAYAKPEGGAAWGPILEKALAGVDQTWDEGRRKVAEGYERLDLGSFPDTRAEILTQLTGKPAYSEYFPTQFDMQGRSPDRQLLDTFREKLAEGSPMLVGTVGVEPGQPRLPHRLIGGHAYEVTKVDDSGKIHLRNPHNNRHPEDLSVDDFRKYIKNRYTTLE